MSGRPPRDEAERTNEQGRDPRRERQADALMRLAADWAFNELLPDDPRNVPFFEWLAIELRERQAPDERAALERRAEEFGRRIARRWQHEVLEVQSEPGPPPLHVAPVQTTAARALELAAAASKAPYVDLAVAAGAGRELWDEDCVEWVDVPAHLAPGRHLAVRVSGDSMTPLLHDGDTLLVRVGERHEQLVSGHIVIARRPDDGYVVKQLGTIGPRELELRSLNPAFPSVRIPRRPGAVLGTVVMRWCAHQAAST